MEGIEEYNTFDEDGRDGSNNNNREVIAVSEVEGETRQEGWDGSFLENVEDGQRQ